MRILTDSAFVQSIVDAAPIHSQHDNAQWLADMLRGRSPPWFGLLLYMLPKLQNLTAHFFESHRGQTHRAGCGVMWKLFSSRDVDPATVPGLRRLRTLRMSCTRAEWKWCCLPSLECLRLDGHVSFGRDHSTVPKSSYVTEIHAEQLTSITLRDQPWPSLFHVDRLGPGPLSFVALKRLHVVLKNIKDEDTTEPITIINRGLIGAAENITSKLQSVVDTLEELYITPHEGYNPHYFSYICPFPDGSLLALHKLKKLCVPESLLVLPMALAQWGQGKDPQFSYTSLPVTLEEIKIFYPTMTFHTWCQKLLSDPGLLPALRQINVKYVIRPRINSADRQTPAPLMRDSLEYVRGISLGFFDSSSEYACTSDMRASREEQLLLEISMRDQRILQLEQQIRQR